MKDDEDDLEHFIEKLLKEAKNCELQENEIMVIFINNVSPRIKHTLINAAANNTVCSALYS